MSLTIGVRRALLLSTVSPVPLVNLYMDFEGGDYLQRRIRTNGIRNSTMVGAGVGVLPTNWAVFANAVGITLAVAGTGTENGMNYVDLRFSGTCTGNGISEVIFDNSVAIPAKVGQYWNVSAYVKYLPGGTNTPTTAFVGMDEYGSSSFLAGNAGTTGGLVVGQMTRISYVRALGNASTDAVRSYVGAAFVNGTTYDFTMRVYGPQTEQSPVPSEYIPTSGTAVTVTDFFATSNPTQLYGWQFTRASAGLAANLDGTWQTFASGAPRTTDQGLLMEETSTNQVRNSAGGGAVTGTPGTKPTNWSVSNSATGVSFSLTRIITEKGLPAIEWRIFGTPSVSAAWRVYFEGTSVIGAAQNQTWAASAFVQYNGSGSVPPNIRAFYDLYQDAAFLTNQSASLSMVKGVPIRASIIQALGAVGTNFIVPGIAIDLVSGTPYDFTVLVYAPQCEQKPFCTSPIITTGAAATRATDAMYMLGQSPILGLPFTAKMKAKFANLDGQLLEFMAVSDGTSSHRHSFRRQADGSAGALTYASAVFQSGNTVVGKTGARSVNIVHRSRHLLTKTAVDGAIIGGSDTVIAANPTGLSTLAIGTGMGTVVSSNAFVQHIGIYGDTTDAQLQGLSA